jgi:hypothetical protein
MDKRAGVFFRFLDGIFLAGLGAYVFLGLVRVPFHGDESTLIRLSMDYAYIFQDRKIQKVIYRPKPDSWSEERYQRVLTGAVDPLAIGLARSAAGMDRGDLNGFWRWYPNGVDEGVFNVAAGNMPSADLLNAARFPSTLFTALSVIAVFAVAFGLSRSRPAAWVAAFLYATAPAVLVNGRRAMQEGAMLLFTSLVVLCGMMAAREIRAKVPRRKRTALWYALLGASCGCALASKHAAALIILSVFPALAFLLPSAGGELPPQEKSRLRLGLLSGWLGSGLLGLSIFYALMPVWWGYPLHWLLLLSLSIFCFLILLAPPGWVGRILRAVPVAAAIGITMIAPRAWVGIYEPIRIIAEARAELTRIHNTLGLDLPDFGSRIGEMAGQLLSAHTQYYESLAWDTLEEEQAQIRVYESAHLDGRGGGPVWGMIILALVLGGSGVLLFRRRGWESFFLLLWLLIPAAVLLAVNTLAWQRYYLVLIAPESVLAGFAAVPIASPGLKKSIWTMSAKQS